MNRPNSHLTRREALKTTAAATAAAIGVPYFVPGAALGKNGATAASNRIAVATIGHGLMMGGHHRTMLNRDDTMVVACCDVREDKRNKAKADTEKKYSAAKPSGNWKGCAAYNEYERIIERDDIDAVMVITPDHWHAPISVAAMRSGKDVYVQKPMTLTIAEGRIMSDVAERYGSILQVGSQQRSNNAFRKACEIVRNGWIGKVHTIYARLGKFPQPSGLTAQPIPAGFDYDRWLGPSPWYPYNEERVKGNYGGGWRRFWEYGSRKNGDWGAHHFDIIQWALGMDDSGPVEFIPKGFGGNEYQTHIYADGTKVLRDHPDTEGQMIRFIGKDGEVLVSRGDKLVTKPGDLTTQALGAKDTGLYESANHEANWIECIKARKQPICTAEIGHRTATICHLSGIAERLGRTIKWDPKREKIIGDEAASRWIDRPRRAPYNVI